LTALIKDCFPEAFVNPTLVTTSSAKETTEILTLGFSAVKRVFINCIAALFALAIFVPDILPERSITSTISEVVIASLPSTRNLISHVLTIPGTEVAVFDNLTSPGSNGTLAKLINCIQAKNIT